MVGLGSAGWGELGGARSGRFIVVNDQTSPKMTMKIYPNFFRFILKVLELFECRRGYLYIIASRNLIRFAYS